MSPPFQALLLCFMANPPHVQQPAGHPYELSTLMRQLPPIHGGYTKEAVDPVEGGSLGVLEGTFGGLVRGG